MLEVSPDDLLLEVGTGTGAFAWVAATRCRTVIALDASPLMLTYAARRAREEDLKNIVFRQEGFLTYEHAGEPVAAAVSQFALRVYSSVTSRLGDALIATDWQEGG